MFVGIVCCVCLDAIWRVQCETPLRATLSSQGVQDMEQTAFAWMPVTGAVYAVLVLAFSEFCQRRLPSTVCVQEDMDI